jgi:hypothetical protein
MSKVLAALLEALGLTWGAIGAGCAGALLSLISLNADASIRLKCYTVGGGIALSIFFTPLLHVMFEMKPGTLSGMCLIVGLFGMAILKEGYELIHSGVIRSIVTAFLQRKTGG